MIPCRATACRPKRKEWLQVREDPALGQLAERRLGLKEGNIVKGAWVAHKEGLPPGVYCGHCCKDLEYSEQDLTDFRLDEAPLLFVPPEGFSVDEVFKSLKKKWGKRIVYVKELDAEPERLADPGVTTKLQAELA